MSALGDALRARIARDGPITFARFMEAALYDPQHGFYARGARLGRGGAFTTVPVALPLFSRALARDLRALWERLGRPSPFTIAEVGPGDGTLLAGLRDALTDLPLELVLCERAAGMTAQAAARVPGARVVRLAALEAVTGAIVANEVHDAQPAHCLCWPHELLVEADARGRFCWVERPPGSPALEGMLRAAGVEPRVGARYEVSPAQGALQADLARRLARGALHVFDYGEAGRARYERPVPRLRTYLAGLSGGDPLGAPGTQDITVDVDFGAVREAGEAAGLCTTLDEPQPAWLRRHGADELRRSLAPESEEARWLHALASDEGSGASFHVLVQERE